MAAAIDKYTSEKLAFETKTSFIEEEEEGENPIINGDNEPGEVDEGALSSSVAMGGGGEGGEGGEGEKETRTEEGEKEEEEEEEEAVEKSERVMSEHSDTYPLPPYHSEVGLRKGQVLKRKCRNTEIGKCSILKHFDTICCMYEHTTHVN